MKVVHFALTVSAACVMGCAGCGQLGDDDGGDAASDVDAMAVPCTSGVFGNVDVISELSSPLPERGLRLTDDELTAVFSARVSDANYGRERLYLATRSLRAAPFGNPIDALAFGESDTEVEVYPSLANDGSSLFREGYCQPETLNGASILCLSTREAGTPFGGDTPIFENFPFGPFGAHSTVGDGFVTPSAQSYYFAGPASGDFHDPFFDGGTSDGGPPYAIFVSPYESYRFSTTSTLTFVPADPAVVVDNPVLSADELTMYVGVRKEGGVQHVARATRASRTAVFSSTLENVSELDSAEGEYPTWISPDGCRLYFTRTVNGQTDLYFASRSPN